MVPVYVLYACRVPVCPYARKGKGKRTWTLDNEGKGKRTLNLQGEEQDHVGKGKRTLNLQGEDGEPVSMRDHVRATIYWGMDKPDEQDYRNEEVFWTRRDRQGKGTDNDEVEPPPGLENERVWPPPALVDAWVRKGKGRGKERAIDVWIGKGPGKDKGNNEVLVGHVWNLVDAWIGKGNGKGKGIPYQ